MATNEMEPGLTPASAAEPPRDEPGGLKPATLTTNQALGLAVVVFSPVLTAATVGVLIGGATGSSGWLSVLAGALVMTCIGVAIAPFAQRHVASGALYSYVGHVFGGAARFVASASLAVGYLVGLMVVLGALGLYAGSMFSSVFGISAANGFVGQAVIYAVTMASAALLAFKSLDASAKLSIALLFLSAPVVLAVLIGNLFSAGFDFTGQFTFHDFSFSGFSLGLALSTTFTVGFETSAATALETKDPVRTVPRVIILVPVIVGGIAVVASLLSVPSLGAVADRIAAGESPVAAMAHHAGLGFLAQASDIALVVTCYAIVVGFMNYAPRVWAAMANDGLLPAAIGRVARRTRTPGTAILVMAVLTAVLPLALAAITGAGPMELYQYLATLFPYLWVVPYILICAGAIVLLYRDGELTVAKAFACAVGALATGWLYLNSLVNPTGTALDAMTWTAPVSIVAMMLIMGVRRLVARPRNTTEETR
ncbi:APC family permease [Streptomyces sp. BH104]|uniref:APC family permease n=1 Tax=Streptomyces sp. BH104 TaxID=3410407 RepID=UPI003BB64455